MSAFAFSETVKVSFITLRNITVYYKKSVKKRRYKDTSRYKERGTVHILETWPTKRNDTTTPFGAFVRTHDPAIRTLSRARVISPSSKHECTLHYINEWQKHCHACARVSYIISSSTFGARKNRSAPMS